MMNIKLNPLWSKTVLVITFSFLLLLSSYVLLDPDGSSKNLSNIYNFFATNFESFFLYFGFGVLLILIFVGVSSAGSKKIILEGRKDYSYFSWYSMLFATGLGAALLYWSTYEWLVYYTDPIVGEEKSLLKARSYPLFHLCLFSAYRSLLMQALVLKPLLELISVGQAMAALQPQ